jgi:hypothetical protein
MSQDVEEHKTMEFADQCVICLSKKIIQPAMLMPCFHSFCTGCISIWLERSDKCPLCNRVADRIIYDIQSQDQYKQIVLPSLKNEADVSVSQLMDLEMNIPQHPNRRRVYFVPLFCIKDSKVHKFEISKIRLIDGEPEERIRQWVIRDLEAILRTYRVQILTEFVMGLISKHDLSTERDTIVSLLKEYIGSLAEHFLDELVLYASSGLGIQAYDRCVKYQKKNTNVERDEEMKVRSKRKRSNFEQIEVVEIHDDDDDDNHAKVIESDDRKQPERQEVLHSEASSINEPIQIEDDDDEEESDDQDIVFIEKRPRLR